MTKNPDNSTKANPTLATKVQSLLDVIAKLRGPDGCPWDKQQTHHTLTQYAIEETFEMVDAIESGNDASIKDELGDVLFQVVLHAQLGKERNAFDFESIVENITEKLIRRHPHVFSDTVVNSTQDVIENWELIKKNESKNKISDPDNILNVPRGLPALQRAYKIGKRTEKIKFDWENANQVMEKVREEYQELEEAMQSQSRAELEHEIGDALFSLAQLARHLDMEPEQILRKANSRFEERFKVMNRFIQSEGKTIEALSLKEKENFWQKAKSYLKNIKP